MKNYNLQYEFLGAHRKFDTTDLREFLQKLEEVEDSDYVPNSSVSIYTSDNNWRSSPPIPIEDLEQLYKDYSIHHESMEDFMNRMEADNGTNWIAKFITT